MMKIYNWVNCEMKHDHDVTPKLENNKHYRAVKIYKVTK